MASGRVLMLGAAAAGAGLWPVEAASVATAAAPAVDTCPLGASSCHDSSSSLASDHQLIQTRGSLSVGRVAQHAPGDFSGRSAGRAPPAAPAAHASRKGRLVWEDNFDGDRLDSSKWSIVSGGGGFGNNEQQYYSHHGLRVGDGVLRITAQCEEYKGHHFTSAKVQTKHLADWGPGHRVEVRARLPKGRGTWPAIWMLPTDNAYGGWPRSGEIDIMEAVGCTQGKVYGTVHTGAYNHMRHTEKFNTLHADIGEWHVFAIEWTASDIAWYMDGQLFHSFGHEAQDSEKWPFDRQFFLILNLAVGGSWGGMCVGGRPSCSSHDEFGHRQVMEVDYARVYAL